MSDQIVVEGLELQCHLGVTDEERAQPQRVTAQIVLTAQRDFNGLRDDIRNAVDYYKVTLVVKEFAARRPRRLLETLGTELAEELLVQFAVSSVDLHLRKYVVPDTAAVGIRVCRDRPAGTSARHR